MLDFFYLLIELMTEPEFVRISESDLEESPPPIKASQAMFRLVLRKKINSRVMENDEQRVLNVSQKVWTLQ
jgi:hypothetical protein